MSEKQLSAKDFALFIAIVAAMNYIANVTCLSNMGHCIERMMGDKWCWVTPCVEYSDGLTIQCPHDVMSKECYIQ